MTQAQLDKMADPDGAMLAVVMEAASVEANAMTPDDMHDAAKANTVSAIRELMGLLEWNSPAWTAYEVLRDAIFAERRAAIRARSQECIGLILIRRID